ncbi:MAG: 1,4-dihydroxy-2-naphthoate polyprenyltransferase, partial [Gemmatimonadaceae bacterium]
EESPASRRPSPGRGGSVAVFAAQDDKVKKSWLLAARPKTLSASVVPVLIGTALAPHPPRWLMFACALAGALFIQIGTNLVNDALDFRKGADTSERVGPVRVTQAGLLSAERVLLAAYVCFGLAAVCGIPLILRGGWPLVAIGVTSIIAAYAYTGGPYPLAYNGLGELFVMVFFGVVAVGGSYYVQTLTIDRAVIVAGIAAGSLACVLLVINNLRDVSSDSKTGKRTMVVRFGEGFARGEVVLFALLPFACTIVVAMIRGNGRLLLPMGALPLATFVLVRVFRSRAAELNRCLAMAGALQWAFGILFVIGALMEL